jgi:hypothetical protein
MNDDPSLMSTVGDGGVPLIYDISLSLYLDLPDRTKSIT